MVKYYYIFENLLKRISVGQYNLEQFVIKINRTRERFELFLYFFLLIQNIVFLVE